MSDRRRWEGDDASAFTSAYGGGCSRLLVATSGVVWGFAGVGTVHPASCRTAGRDETQVLSGLAKTVQADAQALHHFQTKGHWSPDVLRACRLEVPRPTPGETPFILCIDETGDCKKGRTTNSVASQYIGTMHTLANGIVTVNAYREK